MEASRVVSIHFCLCLREIGAVAPRKDSSLAVKALSAPHLKTRHNSISLLDILHIHTNLLHYSHKLHTPKTGGQQPYAVVQTSENCKTCMMDRALKMMVCSKAVHSTLKKSNSAFHENKALARYCKRILTSCPRISFFFIPGIRPSYICKSLPHMHVLVTLMIASPCDCVRSSLKNASRMKSYSMTSGNSCIALD